MGKYIVRRILQMIPVILGTTFIIFTMVFALGDPLVGRCGERPCSAAYQAAFRAEYNLDKPFIVQYALYVLKLITGDLGTNFYGNTVISELATRYPATLRLAVIAIALEIIVGIGAGVLAGVRKGKLIDTLVTLSTLILISIPVFVLGSLAQMIFGVQLGWFPVTAGAGDWWQLALPGIVLGSLNIAYVARLTRTSLVENLRADYVRTAKAKGLSWQRTIGLHTLRNSLIPVMTFVGASFGGLLGGAIVTERIFNVNGIGSFIFRSINTQDGTSIIGAVVVLVLVYLVTSLMVDLLYGALDPRISNE